MDTNELKIVANKKVDLYDTTSIHCGAIDENTLYSFNRNYDFKPDPRGWAWRCFATGKVLIHRFPTQ